MRRFTALVGALLLTLVMASPAAAAKPYLVFEGEDNFTGDPVSIANWGFECTDPIWYGQRGVTESLKLWFLKSDFPIPLDPDGFPTILPVKGKYERQGTDFFYNEAGDEISGSYRLIVRSFDFEQVSEDVATWKERTTGNLWGIQLPGNGNVFNESGNILWMVENFELVGESPLKYVGNATFDLEKLCGAFGYGVVLPAP